MRKRRGRRRRERENCFVVDIVVCCLSFTWFVDGTPSVKPVEVVMKGLVIVLPIISEELLKVRERKRRRGEGEKGEEGGREERGDGGGIQIKEAELNYCTWRYRRSNIVHVHQ